MDKTEFAALKVGDKVTVRKWDDIIKEYGPNRGGYIFINGLYFYDKMKIYCGNTYTIEAKSDRKPIVQLKGCEDWVFSPELLESKKATEEGQPVIVEHLIRGNKTIVKLSNGKVGVARCNPEDVFDVFEGLRQAAARAYGKTLPLTFEESMAKFAAACKKAAKAAEKEKKKKEAAAKKAAAQEKKAEKPVFVPYLTHFAIRAKFGVIGENTKYKDVVGRPLKVGDTVEIYKDGSFYNECAVVALHEKVFVFGIRDCCDDKTGKIERGWKIIKKRSFEEVKDGEVVGGFVKYIKTEAAENA